MDLLAICTILFGFLTASRGYHAIGAVLVIAPALLLPGVLTRVRGMRLLLPWSFPAWFGVLALAVVLTVLLPAEPWNLRFIPLGMAVWYYGCLALVEDKVRYVPWGSGLGWKTAARNARPAVYWSVTLMSFALSAALLGAPLAAAAGWLPGVQGR